MRGNVNETRLKFVEMAPKYDTTISNCPVISMKANNIGGGTQLVQSQNSFCDCHHIITIVYVNVDYHHEQ